MYWKAEELRSTRYARRISTAAVNQRLNRQKLMQSLNPEVTELAERMDGQSRYSPGHKETAASGCATSPAARVWLLVGTGVVVGAVLFRRQEQEISVEGQHELTAARGDCVQQQTFLSAGSLCGSLRSFWLGVAQQRSTGGNGWSGASTAVSQIKVCDARLLMSSICRKLLMGRFSRQR